MAISDKLTKLKSDLTDSYKELNIDNLAELGDKNTNNLPTAIDNVLDTIKGYIPTNTDTEGVCENAIPLNASVVIDGNSEQDTSKMTYKCDGTETGDYYFVYNSINYQFTMPTITSSSVLVFDTSTLKLYLDSTEIATTTASTGTLITLIASPNPDYPQEIEVVRGKNLYSHEKLWYNSVRGYKANISDRTDTSLIITSTSSNAYTTFAPGQPGGSSEYRILLNPNTTYTFSLKHELLSGTAGYSIYVFLNSTAAGAYSKLIAKDNTQLVTFTTDDTNLYMWFRFDITNANTSYKISEIQLEQGTTATTYLPYNTIELEQSGKNLLQVKNGKSLTFDGLTVSIDEEGIITLNGTLSGYYPTFLISETGDIEARNGTPNITNNPNWYKSLNIPNNTYTFTYEYISGTGEPSWRPFIWRHTSSGKNIELTQSVQTATKTFTGEVAGISFYVDNGRTYDDYKFRLQLEQGDTSTTYEPYHEPQTYQISLGDNYLAKVGDVKDELSIDGKGNAKKIGYIGETIFDGSDDVHWYKNADSPTENYISFYCYGYFNRNIAPKCNYFIGALWETIASKEGNYCWSATVSCGFRIHKDNLDGYSSTMTDDEKIALFKNWLSTHNTKVLYQLATPTEETLQTDTPIHMWEGTNIFTLDTNIDTDFTVTYYIDAQQALLDTGTEV